MTSPKKRRKRTPPRLPPREETFRHYTRQQTIKAPLVVFARFAGAAVLALALYPSIRVLAGRQTGVHIGIAITVSVAINVALAGASVYLWRQLRETRKRLDQIDRKQAKLDRRGTPQRRR